MQNADGCDDYYIVPFVEESNTDVNRTLVVVLVDAEDGSFKEASWVADPVKYLPVSKREALRLVLEEIWANQLKAFGMPSIELVDSGPSPYLPDWKITRGNYVFYVTQDGVVSCELIARNWPQFHYDTANTGYTTSYAPDVPNLLWDSGDIGAVASSQPLVVRNKVIVWADDKVYVLDKATGAEIWNASVAGDTQSYGSWATPAYSNLALYVSSGYNLTKFDVASGTTTDIIFPDGGYSCNGGPTVADGVVFAGSGFVTYPESAHYYAFYESNLTEKWSFEVVGSASSTPAVADGKVFVGSGTRIHCLDETTGSEVWNYTASGWPYVGGSLTYADGYVYGAYYVFDVAGAYGPVYKLDAETGAVQSGWPVMVKATDSTPAVVDDRVYICGGCSPWAAGYEYNGVGVYCFDTDGNEIWKNESDETELIMGSWTCSPAVADGMVFVGDPSNAYGEMFEFNGTYALDAATGDVEWYLPYGGASPAVADDMVFTIARGHVYAFGLLKTYGERVHSKNNVIGAWRALDKPDRRGATMRRNANIAIEMEETIPNCTTVSVWARKVALRNPGFDVYVSSDGTSWTEIGSATCNKWRWQRFDFTGDWEDVKYIEIRKPGSRWRPKLMGLDAVYAEGQN